MSLLCDFYLCGVMLSQGFQFLSVSALINAGVFSGVILYKKKASVASVFLCLLLLGVSLQSFLNAFDTRSFFWEFPHLLKWSWVNPTFFSAALYLFVRYLVSPSPRFRWKDVWAFAPFVVYVSLLFPFFVQSATEKRTYIDNFQKASADDFGLLPQLNILFVGTFIVLALLRIRKHRKQIDSCYSTTDKLKLRWLSALLYAILGTFVITVIGFFARKWEIPVITHIYHYNYLLVVGLVYWIGIQFLLRPQLFEGMRWLTVPSSLSEVVPNDDDFKEERGFTMNNEEAKQLQLRLRDLMEKEMAYRNAELDILGLSQLANEKKHRVSYVINELEGKNFFDYVNGYRVEEVKQALLDPAKQQFTILALALDAGFNSKSTFNHIFKKYTQQSPSEYRKVHNQGFALS